MINIELLSEDKILTLKNNKSEVLTNIKNFKDNLWLKDFFKEEMPFLKSKLYCNDFEFDMSKNSPEETDFENAKRLYSNLKISESQASDERLWMGLTFSKFYDYMNYRYPVNQTLLKNKWLFQDTATKQQLFRQGLSMLWWYAHITYDNSNIENPFELTEFAFDHKDFLISIYSRNFCGSKNITLGVIKALKQYELNGGDSKNRNIYNGLVKYISFLGGAYILDDLSIDEIYSKSLNKLYELDQINKSNFNL